jgi:hypothetical protein
LTGRLHQVGADAAAAIRALDERVAVLEQSSAKLAGWVESLGAGRATDESQSAPRSSAPSGWTEEDRRRLEDQGLFVVGSGRSGTTIMYETLNLSPDVYLLGEAFLYKDANRPDFAEFLHRRHVSYGNLKSKGHYPPRPLHPGENGFGLLRRLGSRYRYVGEKVAFGADAATDPADAEQFLEFQATHFFHSGYVLTLRHPVETVWSLASMWPRIPTTTHLAIWTVSLRVLLELSLGFPRTWLVTLDRLDEGAASRLGRTLGIEITVPPGRFAREYQSSALAHGQLPPPLAGHHGYLTRMSSLYDDVREAFDPQTFRYCRAENPRAFGQRVWDRANTLLADLSAGGPALQQAG